MSLQSDVSKLSRDSRQNADCLDQGVMKAWEDYDGERMLSVFAKLHDVAVAAIESGGDNDTVESTRGVAKKRAAEWKEALLKEREEMADASAREEARSAGEEGPAAASTVEGEIVDVE